MGVLEKLQVLLSMNGDQFKGDVDKSKQAVGDFKQGLKDMAAEVGIGAIGIGTLVQGLKFSVEQAAEAEKIQAQLGAVLKSTGGAAGMSAEDINDMATALSEMSAVEDDAIVQASAVMLTFTKIGKDVFPDAMTAALNMSAALDTDLQGAVIQLGKALNDPVQGVGALRRVGVSFTEDQQAMIQALVDSNDLLGAQRMVLAELNVEFGGAAEAMGDTFLGKVDRAKNALGNLGETVGEKLLPALGSAAEGLTWIFTYSDKVEQALTEANESLVYSTSSYEEYTAALIDNYAVAKNWDEATRERAKSQLTDGTNVEMLSDAYGGLTQKQWEQTRAIEESARQQEFLATIYTYQSTPAIEDNRTALEKNQEALEGVDAVMQKYTAQLLYNKAAANLDAEAALSLARGMGLVDERTAFMIDELPRLQEIFDENRDGFIDAEEAASGYTAAVEGLNNTLLKLPKDIPINIWLQTQGQPGAAMPSVNLPGGGGGPEVLPMARGGDFMVHRPTLFLAGEGGTERAIFIPQGKEGATGSGNTYVTNINNDLAAAMWMDEMRRNQAEEAEKRM